MESATSNCVWYVAPASIFNHTLLILRFALVLAVQGFVVAKNKLSDQLKLVRC